MSVKVLKFSADWCQPCRMVTPVFEQLKQEFSNVEFQNIDIDSEEGQKLATKYSVRNIPLVVIESEAKTIRFAGVKPKGEYEQAIKDSL